MSNIIKIAVEVDIDELKQSIENSKDLENDEAVFKALSAFALPKKELGDALDAIASVEAEMKAAINSKATALYGDKWSAIKGHGFKITRKAYGSVYTMTGKVQKKFVKITESLDSKMVEAYVLTNNKLPAGVEYNPNRGSSISIKVDDVAPDTTEA